VAAGELGSLPSPVPALVRERRTHPIAISSTARIRTAVCTIGPTADVTTAGALSVERLADIQRSLAAATGRTVDLTSRVDPSIVGGMVARIGSTVYDGSIVSHLKRIRQRLDASI